MHWFKHHIGDYTSATAHLTFLEDAAFMRLLRIYHREERPISLDVRAVQRLTGARTQAERQAIESVLREFFVETAEGWRRKTCDDEIKSYQSQAETNRRNRAAGRQRPNDESSVDRQPNQNREPRTDNREPDSPTPQTREEEACVPARTVDHLRAEASRACALMSEVGCTRLNPSRPELLGALGEGVTPEMLADVAREAIEARKTNPFAWAIATARRRYAEARPRVRQLL